MPREFSQHAGIPGITQFQFTKRQAYVNFLRIKQVEKQYF
jgi:hypothetical protein